MHGGGSSGKWGQAAEAKGKEDQAADSKRGEGFSFIGKGFLQGVGRRAEAWDAC